MKVFFHVQHLLGIGHLKRAATLADALARGGFEVTLASGGLPVDDIVSPRVRLVQLPPASAEDASFRHLVDDAGRRVDDDWKHRRKNALLAAFEDCSPDLLLIELYPFGRRQMRFELEPLLERAAGRAIVACSVRDLIQDKPERHEEMLAVAGRFFDRILVHGDPRLASFPLAGRLGDKLHYTGYVVGENQGQGDAGAGEVLVSAGGGAVGRKLLETAIRARPLSMLRDRPWRVITGINGPDLSAFQQEGIVIEKMRQDFTTLLRNCELSISQAGYNTVMETLQARTRALLVPYRGAAETEQTLRARLLAARGLAEVLEESLLEPAALAAAADRAAQRARPSLGAIDLGGARRTAELLREWARG